MRHLVVVLTAAVLSVGAAQSFWQTMIADAVAYHTSGLITDGCPFALPNELEYVQCVRIGIDDQDEVRAAVDEAIRPYEVADLASPTPWVQEPSGDVGRVVFIDDPDGSQPLITLTLRELGRGGHGLMVLDFP